MRPSQNHCSWIWSSSLEFRLALAKLSRSPKCWTFDDSTIELKHLQNSLGCPSKDHRHRRYVTFFNCWCWVAKRREMKGRARRTEWMKKSMSLKYIAMPKGFNSPTRSQIANLFPVLLHPLIPPSQGLKSWASSILVLSHDGIVLSDKSSTAQAGAKLTAHIFGSCVFVRDDLEICCVLREPFTNLANPCKSNNEDQ